MQILHPWISKTFISVLTSCLISSNNLPREASAEKKKLLSAILKHKSYGLH